MFTTEEILEDYSLAVMSREVSTLGRKEVMMGKAKFGIFGGGKEVAQVAMARFFKKGDFRSGYYRDQTFMFAIGEMTAQQMFAQLYAHADIKHEPVAGGRLMTGNFGTRFLNEDGTWRNLVDLKNSTTDVSPTASQMPRLVGLAYASKLFRENKNLHQYTQFSNKGNEIAFGTIGNASTSEGLFFESINAAGVLKVPMLVSVWDDGYGISVPGELQTTKGDISAILAGFQRDDQGPGYEIFKVAGWNYPELCNIYRKATKYCREEHVPVIVHANEMTQPFGHSTSGSHERYKPKERLEWEKDNDCIKRMREWILESGIATEKELEDKENTAKLEAKEARNAAWKAYTGATKQDFDDANAIISRLIQESKHKEEIIQYRNIAAQETYMVRSHIVKMVKDIIHATIGENTIARKDLLKWHEMMRQLNHERYSTNLYNDQADSVMNVKGVPATYGEEKNLVDGFEVIRHFWDVALANDPRIFAIGEDVGLIGDVNQGFSGLQEKYSDLRVTDTGIRECTIVGQAIGAAMRGLKPVAEIQYLDYILYAIQIMSDDLATIQFRSHGQQKAPLIVRTRGHRLQGVWHSGSPLGIILNCIRGVYICVPRNMTQAVGMYNALLQSGDPGLVIECLNAYRKKEDLPTNLGEFTVELGESEIIREGTDITIVTYGAMCQICLDGATKLQRVGISCEIVDVQTLIPFDKNNVIAESIKKTNRVLFADEDVPGGATAYMLQKVIENEEAYYYLDSKPKTIHSWAHRPAYATDGDYFSKPNAEDVFDYVYEVMQEVDPDKFPPVY